MLYNVNNNKEKIVFGMDSVVIQKYISGIPGGRTLNIDANYPLDDIFAGQVIIKKVNEEGVATYAPMPIKAAMSVSGEGENQVETPVLNEDGSQKFVYDTMPEGAVIVGVLYRSISKKQPAASIMYDGVINDAIAPFDFASVKAEVLKACPNLICQQDEIA